MADKTAQQMEDLLTLYTSTLFEVPFARAKVGLGMGEEKEMLDAAWKGYDAWVRLISTSLDELYRNPLFGNFVARSFDRWLRWQRISQAMSGAFFAALWPAVGLPTAATVQALHEELSSLSVHLKTRDATIQTLRAELCALQTRSEELRFLATRNGTTHNGTQTAPEKRLANSHPKNGHKTSMARPLH